MLTVLTPDEVFKLIEETFKPVKETETVELDNSLGRTLAEDIRSCEYVPSFDRSTVDGYALKASDTFGCSESIPAILSVCGEVLMGQKAEFTINEGQCAYIPTGGQIPDGADCAVMIEYTEDYQDGTIGIMKPGAPGLNMIFKGDDVFPGKTVIRSGRVITPTDIGAMAAIGVTKVPVVKKPLCGIISTGDELVPPDEVPAEGQVRDTNSALLKALFTENGAECRFYGIVKDDKSELEKVVRQAADECDAVILSGGSSVGVKDAACDIIRSVGEMLFHGIAIKPGKPTMMGIVGNKPIIGLPGHPVAAYFVSKVFVVPLISRLLGREDRKAVTKAILTEDMGANHGRAQYNAVKLSGNKVFPVRSKSGLISQLAGTDGYLCIDRDCEGLAEGTEVEVFL